MDFGIFDQSVFINPQIDFNFTRQNSRISSVVPTESIPRMPFFVYKFQNQINPEVNEFVNGSVVNVTKFGDFQNWKGKLKAVTNMQ